MIKHFNILRQSVSFSITVLFVFLLCSVFSPVFLMDGTEVVSVTPADISGETLFPREKPIDIIAPPAVSQLIEANILKDIARLNFSVKKIFFTYYNFKSLIVTGWILSIYLFLYLVKSSIGYRHVISLPKGGHAPPCPEALIV